MLKSNQTLDDLQEEISRRLIPREAQKLLIEVEETQEELKDESIKILELPIDKNEVDIILSNKHTKEFYGFHSNRHLTYQNFCKIRIENED